ncbi:molybdate ABC transporter substrate-binding protein [Pelagerythrobacter sp.]|uniref:molybdate ABC transporter substrate-binding protein n=1 Tax=Pelagerythrobacter sp. TaxID=2800702 RepID=UPI0035B41044
MTRTRSFLAGLAAFLIASCSAASDDAPVVLAAASLQGALDEVADGWASEGHARPVISYAGSQAHARQIQAGAPADVAFLADEDWMDTLDGAGLLAPGTRRNVISNAMVIVRPAGEEARTDLSLGEALAGERIAMGEPETVPAGRYGKAALVSLDLWSEIAPRVVPAENVRAALALAERGEVDAAIVYASDAAASDRVTVAARLPEGSHPPIRYPAAVLTSSTSADAAGFVEYLSSPEAARIFARHGFTALPPGG